ncbi:hypothetical protein [Rhizobium ruizarguesonis]|uniref:hypothetical protein n=1 Tax=Rhizobium ruizarguesonis TaxID=2081791 RepID=UPI001030706D|nr:hypothetical protein [Rhizobium ruizarguesonis]TBB03873.1 hypothetical protein ELH52_20755 [Rhizobium ruizarguesonis]
MINWVWADQLGSFLGGIATTVGLIGLYFVYRQWDDDHRAKILTEKQQREAELRLAATKLADEINLSTDMLLIERSKLWAQALNRYPSDFVARSVLAAAAVRTTISATSRMQTAMAYARQNGLGDELRRSFDNALGILQVIGKEDLALVNHLQDYDLRFSKLSADVHKRLRSKELSEAEFDMLAFHSQDGLIQTSQVFLSLADTVVELGSKVKGLHEELKRRA